MSDENQPWWQRLQSPTGQPLPFSVAERLDWYARQARRQRIGNYVLETATIVLAASIPAAATLGPPAAVTGILGAGVAVLTGLRQLVRAGENWIRFSGALVALQREAALWSAGRKPYDGADADQLLVEQAEGLVVQEAARWAEQRSPRTSAAPASGAT
jgi:hypothetical protein